jgi:hypothetical protein
MSGWMDRWVSGWMDGWMGGWTGEKKEITKKTRKDSYL